MNSIKKKLIPLLMKRKTKFCFFYLTVPVVNFTLKDKNEILFINLIIFICFLDCVLIFEADQGD